ncbi:CbtA family protein [Limimaricola cinnabarinus]|uniref:Predicted cobalt transporter CbtA n=1 Tax=Limimaricola cinnabarinus LL-001 TaxID=1337093 RepID=U3AN44_9RHOB|nr:CbtA family protein [Limimaricola cinnabarinus]GAD56168.1 predicted cobalt transporter CbtA [Limimaricola cinnabarinus LL-001]
MLKQIGASALFAGLAAGVLAALLQLWFVVPLLMEAELYETGARAHFTDGYIGSDAGAPPLGDAIGRHLGTIALNIVGWIGFGFVLAAGFALAARRGVRIDARAGLLWGLAGFAALALAPAFGLPPELPGTIAAEVSERQLWWGVTVVATALGLAVMAFGRGPGWLAGGAALIALPHLIGAPHLDRYFGTAAPELGALFATRALGVSAVAWALLGLLAGGIWSREAA